MFDLFLTPSTTGLWQDRGSAWSTGAGCPAQNCPQPGKGFLLRTADHSTRVPHFRTGKEGTLQKAAHTYYETGGSFTTGLRSAALVIHEALLAKSRPCGRVQMDSVYY